MATAFFTVLGNLYLLFGTALMATLTLLAVPIPPRGYWGYRVARSWARTVLRTSGVRLVIERAAHLELDRSYVLMPNHTSLMDIPVLLASSEVRLCFVAKRQLFHIPILGWALRSVRYIPVDREDRRQAASVLKAAAERLEAGESILIFPEETRSPDGRLLEFKRGGFLLALRERVPVVPVGIRGSHRVRAKRGLAIRPGVVEVRYGAPIAIERSGAGSKTVLISAVREAVEALSRAEPV